MTTMGSNMKIEIAESRREEMRRFYENVLRCHRAAPRPDLDVYTFDGGFNLGVYYVADERALPADAWKRAPWIELVVDDAAQTKAALAEQGFEPFAHFDQEHDYFAGPGGLVFRLAERP